MEHCKDCLHFKVCEAFGTTVEFPVDDGVCLHFAKDTNVLTNADRIRAMSDELPENLMEIPINDDFGAILNCAVRYAIGRQTYMPGHVIDFIRPLLPFIDDNTLWVFDKDIEEATRISLGDPFIDAPKWNAFHEAVKTERRKRTHKSKEDK